MSQLSFPFDKLLPLADARDVFTEPERYLQVLCEGRQFERKRARYDHKELGQYFSMWANTAPSGGLLAVGIEDDGRVTGCKALSSEELNKRELVGRIYCPDARADSKLVPVKNDKGEDDFILLFSIYYKEDRVVRTVSGEAYIRIGDQKHQLSQDQIRELEIDRRQVDFEQEAVLQASYPQDFDVDLITRFNEAFCRSRAIPFGVKTNEEVLVLRLLGKMRGEVFVPNVACVLVFGNNPRSYCPGCRIRFRRFESEHERTGKNYNAIKDLWAEGNIPTVIDQAVAIVQSQVREFSVLGREGRFVPIPEYPTDVWLEAIVNACAHRSYGMKNMHTTIDMFQDRLLVESPGAFPPCVTAENIYTAHNPRNPIVMEALLYLGYVKFAHEGTRRMRDLMVESQLPEPRFEQCDMVGGYSVRVTLRNNFKGRPVWIDSSVSSILGEHEASALSQEESRAINYVVMHGKINVSDFQGLVASTIKTWHTARKILMRLTKSGILEYVHRTDILRDPDAHFVLTEKYKDGINSDAK